MLSEIVIEFCVGGYGVEVLGKREKFSTLVKYSEGRGEVNFWLLTEFFIYMRLSCCGDHEYVFVVFSEMCWLVL